MSGHSKWHSIKHKKGAADAKRGAMFTKVAKLITIAAQHGGDPEMNPTLRTAIDKAKAINMPNSNVDRAIKKGTGELKDGNLFEEIIYEGYGPGGVALYIQVVTDNKNRAVSDVKSILSKNGGSLGTSGCVSWMFEQKGIIEIDTTGRDIEEIELAAIEAGAEDVKAEEETVLVRTALRDLRSVKDSLSSRGFPVASSEAVFIPKDEVKITDGETARKILRLMDALEDNEDVASTASNFDISEEIMLGLG